MKNLILSITLIFLCVNAFSQSISLNDLKYVDHHSLGDIEEYLTTKGYDYDGTDTSKGDKSIVNVSFVRSSDNNPLYLKMTQILNKKRCLGSSVGTYLKSNYLAFKDSIKRLGYIKMAVDITKEGHLFLSYKLRDSNIYFDISKVNSRIYYVIGYDDNSNN